MNTKPRRQLTAIITGASRGIGKAMAQALSVHGANIILAGRSIDNLNTVLTELPAHTGKTHCMTLDLADSEDIERFVRCVKKRMGQVDILVHCAAIYRSGTWIESSIDDFDELYRTNIRGSYALTKYLLPLLIKSHGDVVFINSSVTAFSGANVGQYAATKHALTGLANSLRAEVNQEGVRILSVYPGRTATPLQETIHQDECKQYLPDSLLQPSDIADMVVACLTLPDTAEVTELHIRPKQKS